MRARPTTNRHQFRYEPEDRAWFENQARVNGQLHVVDERFDCKQCLKNGVDVASVAEVTEANVFSALTAAATRYKLQLWWKPM